MKRKRIARYMNFIIVGIALILMIWVWIQEYRESQIEKRNSQYQTSNLSSQEVLTQQQEKGKDKEPIKEYPKEEIINQYKGYNVMAKLEIPIIQLETYILEKYSEQALNTSITKFWGANANQVGNFCVAGHNFKNKNMFHDLRKLQIGNQFTISDHSIGKIEYEVYDIYTVLPNDVSCLAQETEGRREVTLITCTNDSQKRIIVKARENL